MNELLLALALICQDATDIRFRQITQKKCVTALLECYYNAPAVSSYENMIKCLKERQ